MRLSWRATGLSQSPVLAKAERKAAMKVLEMTNLLGDSKQYDLFLLIPSVNVLPCIDQYVIYGRVHDTPQDLEPLRIFDEAQEALTFCQQCNESRRE